MNRKVNSVSPGKRIRRWFHRKAKAQEDCGLVEEHGTGRVDLENTGEAQRWRKDGQEMAAEEDRWRGRNVHAYNAGNAMEDEKLMRSGEDLRAKLSRGKGNGGQLGRCCQDEGSGKAATRGERSGLTQKYDVSGHLPARTPKA